MLTKGLYFTMLSLLMCSALFSSRSSVLSAANPSLDGCRPFHLSNSITVDSTDLDFPIGTKWTYMREEQWPIRSLFSTVTFEVVDTLQYQGRLASQVDGSDRSTWYLSEEGTKVYFYDDHLRDWILLWDFDATNTYRTRYPAPVYDTIRSVEVAIDSLYDIWTGADRGMQRVQEVSLPIIADGPGNDTIGLGEFSVLQRVGFLRGTYAPSPFHWGYDSFADFNYPNWGRLRCFENPEVFMDFTPVFPEQSCDTSYWEFRLPFDLTFNEENHRWYIWEEDGDAMVNRRYRLSRDSLLLDGNYYHLVLTSDQQTGQISVPTDYYIGQQGSKVYRYHNGAAHLLYDYDHQVGDRIPLTDHNSIYDALELIGADTVTQSPRSPTMHRQLYYAGVVDGAVQADTCMTVLSGLGSLSGMEFTPDFDCKGSTGQELSCVLRNSSVIYHYDGLTSGLEECWRLTSSTSKEKQNTTVRIYPNPTTGYINIEGLRSGASYQVRVLNHAGQLVHSGLLSHAKSSVDLTQLQPGMYYVEIISVQQVTTHKVLIAR